MKLKDTKEETNRQKHMMKMDKKVRDKQTQEHDDEGHKRQRQIGKQNMMKKDTKGRDKQTKEHDKEGHKRQRQIDKRM